MADESKMVERVARGLVAHSWELGGNEHARTEFIDRRWPHYVGQARAAISAMREPTEEMRTSGDLYTEGDDADAIWRNMINAALSSGRREAD